MPTSRSKLVDVLITPWYHCISRCVRRAFLCGDNYAHRKQWIENRVRELVGIFAIECAGFSVMDNHLHLLLRIDSRKAEVWSGEEVARRWFALFPMRDIQGKPTAITDARVARFAANADWIAEMRKRLANLGWFMKSLKEPLARMANKQEGVSGAFWEGRFKSVGILDEESLLATAAYIDLNPLAAGIVATPEESAHTSLVTRISHCQANGTVETLRDDLSVLSRNPAQEAGLWLLPVDDNRSQGGERPGLHDGMTLSCYLRLVDASSRMIRAGKASLEADMAPIFERLGLDQHVLESTASKLFEPGSRISNRLSRCRTPERVDADHVRSGTKAHGEPRLATQQLIC
jgi:REP element-mobilizing transposase RayT